MRRRAIHEEVNHPLRLGRKMWKRAQPPNAPPDCPACPSLAAIKLPNAADPIPMRRTAEKLPPVHHELIFSNGVHTTLE